MRTLTLAFLITATLLTGCAHTRPTGSQLAEPAPPPLPSGHMHITVDNVMAELWINGSRVEVPEETANDWTKMSSVGFPVREGRNVIAVKAVDQGVIAGLLADIEVGARTLVSDGSWKWALKEQDGWNGLEFDDSTWGDAHLYGQYPLGVWGTRVHGLGADDTDANWIWSPANILDGECDPVVFFRYAFVIEPGWVVWDCRRQDWEAPPDSTSQLRTRRTTTSTPSTSRSTKQ